MQSKLLRLAMTLGVISISFLGWPQQLSAQSTDDDSLPSINYRPSDGSSVAGGPIVSWPSDPFMTTAQEAAILRELNKPTDFGWGLEITIAQVAILLGKRVPTVIDVRSLEEFGLTPDLPLRSSELMRRPSPRRGESDQPVSKSAGTYWWRTSAKPYLDTEDGKIASPSLLAELLWLLQENELTLQVKSNQVMITTKESALDDSPLRIYDVTPLIESNELSKASSVPLHAGFNSPAQYLLPASCGMDIMEMIRIHIDPTGWEEMGGTSTVSIHHHRDKRLLIVSTLSTTHWKIQALLNRLNAH